MTKLDRILKDKTSFEDFLNGKGLKRNKNYNDDAFPDATFFELGENRLLAVQEYDNEEKVKEIKNHFLVDKGLTHCALFSNERIFFYRNFGEIRYFVYSKLTQKNKSKMDKLENIDSNFDILFQFKDISKKFYDEFRKQRDLLVRSIDTEMNNVQKYLIAQKIFDRIFFIYFLCHKGIIHFEDNKNISGKNLFKIFLDQEDFLENLYVLFKKFNEEKKSPLKIDNYNLFIPFLNGGLFRISDIENNLSSTWTNNNWESTFNFLNEYHWIIEDSNEELEEEKILTPEILGHVYERSVVEWEKKGMLDEVSEAMGKSARKSLGVYYTPEYVTEYICRNSIHVWLLGKLDNSYNTMFEFLERGSTSDLEKALVELDSIKIMDPACGSGAFLIRSADILFKLKSYIFSKLRKTHNYYSTKLYIISNNIFGVDILDGATEITKLRLWLWLISSHYEEDTVSPLPNIEYNVVVGDSLIGWKGEELKTISVTTPFSGKVEGSLNTLIELSNLKQKKILEESINLLNNFSSNDYIKAYSNIYQLYRSSHTKYAKTLKMILVTIRSEVYSSINQSFLNFLNGESKKKKTILLSDLKTTPFHWNCDFGQIIQNGGFDVIVGNPPYYSIQTIKNKNYQSILSKQYSDVYSGLGDILYLFFRLSIHILKKDGVLGFITSRYFLEAKYAKGLRKYLQDNIELIEILDFGSKIRIFEEASTNNAITISKNNNKQENNLFNASIIKEWDKENENLFNFIKHNLSKSVKNNKIEIHKVSQKNMSPFLWSLDSSEVEKIKDKLNLNSKYLGPFPDGEEGVCRVFQSVTSGLGDFKNEHGEISEVFRVTPKTIKKKKLEKELLKPLLKVGMIRRYKINPLDKYLILTTDDTKIDDYPNIKKHLTQFKNELEDRHDYKTGNFDWWRIVNLRNIDWLTLKQDKLFVPMSAPENRFVYIHSDEYYCEGDMYVLMIIDNDFNLRYVQGILNSNLMNLFIKRNAKKLDGGAKTEKSKSSGRMAYSTNNIKNVPIKIVSNKQQKEISSLVEKIEKLYNEKEKSSEKDETQREIELVDSKINSLVNKMYNITNNEIEILKS
jgi:hypothetical protein